MTITTVCGAAVWKGGPSERIGAVIVYGSWLLTMVAASEHRRYPQLGEFAVDLLTVALMVVLALRSDRYWPMAMAGIHLLVAATHAGRLIDPELSSWVYYTAIQIWGYLLLIVLAVATWQRWREGVQLEDLRAGPGFGGDQAIGRRKR